MSLVNTASPSTNDFVDISATSDHNITAVRGELVIALPMRHAGMRELRLRYELIGAAHAPVVFVAGGISAHRHLAASALFPEKGWVDGLVGSGRALDPAARRLLAFDFLGADGNLDAPIDTADQADAIAALLDALGIGRLHGFVGYSYGALVGLQFAIRHAARVGTLVAVSGAHRAHPYAAAWRALQRRAVALGQLQCAEQHGLALARQFAMLSYRTPEEFSERFDAPPEVINGRVRVAAEDYLDAAGVQYVARTPVNAYLRLSESIDLHRIDPAQVRVPTVVVAVEGDRLVPLADMVSLVEGLGRRGSLRVLRSPYGHDAFLKENDRIDAILTTALRSTGETA
ncbi:homoserine O-succinyltransferase [Xanthomonas prunicola]|uniref:Homoserine O-succinyltransferase n=1 Tax=Xanthomonas prunicola TaxID=2053930 RepID=A0A9Q9IW67_9XANT|nr:homoserine O-succinyltransferase [Xanthomonas prunicola]USI99637.1 homoserine O-succinyltransferase [Xanthomonas prunicola]UXA48092.1 homoserine O-succinyltransferase [Xanthomonas prunicola]UXA56556.1 homoserine O-succinyltransferase [Xanthomonas prunicola]UXA62515.1 homoserine O-succinyltransferase [Xanthomonas prunicola]UXA64715.1 homoserine O-succinyltransferase [Xanthomonas prunicola]